MSQVRTFCRICEPSCGLRGRRATTARWSSSRLTATTPSPRASPATRGWPRSTSTAIPTASTTRCCATPTARWRDGRRGTRRWRARRRGCRRSSTSTGRTRSAPTSATPPASTRWPRCTSARCCYSHRRPPHVLVGHAGLRQQVRGVSEAVFGTSTVHPIPDLEHTDLCLIIGENPRASQASFYSIPNVLGELRRATGRGARIVFVNPRRIETPGAGRRRHRADPARHRRVVPGRPPPRDRSARRVRRRRAGPPRQPRRRAAGASSPDYPADRVAPVTGVAAGDRPRAGGGVGGHAAAPRCTRRPASTWAARARSPTGWCTCCRSSPAASTSRAAT